MKTTSTLGPPDASVPAVVPEPAHGAHAAAAHGRSMSREPARSTGRRNPVGIVLAKLLSAIRGDKYMIDAYPRSGHGASVVRDGDRLDPRSSAE